MKRIDHTEERERVARAIWGRQRAALSDQQGCAAERKWRSSSVPARFWDEYLADADAAIAAMKVSEQK